MTNSNIDNVNNFDYNDYILDKSQVVGLVDSDGNFSY